MMCKLYPPKPKADQSPKGGGTLRTDVNLGPSNAWLGVMM